MAIITGTANGETLAGTAGNDAITGKGGDDVAPMTYCSAASAMICSMAVLATTP